MDTLTVSLVQADLVWEDKKANLRKLENMLAAASVGDLVLLPEMFPTGFSMQPHKLWEEKEGEAFRWMQRMADRHKCAISGSIIVKDGAQYFNRLYFVLPSGEYEVYDKKHLFTLAGEEKVYSAGKSRLVVQYKGWRIMPLVCYDLRFPVWCRNTEEVDLQFFVANWPNRRAEAWKALLKARAIENMCFVAGLNRVGNDGNEIYHSGDSALYDELGNIKLQLSPGKEEVKSIELNKKRMHESRQHFQFLSDRDSFEILD